MSVFDLFSKRKKKAEGKSLDVFSYDNLPETLRIQIVHIVNATIGSQQRHFAAEIYSEIHKILKKEYGVFSLYDGAASNYEALMSFLLRSSEIDRCLDLIELLFRAVEGRIAKIQRQYEIETGTTQSAKDALLELNIRFKEAAVGYEFQSGEIIRVDSQYIHNDAVKPALVLLRKDKNFAGANEEFLLAHEHYRHSRHKDVLVYCLKAFESLMKAICKKRKWQYDTNDTASKLISHCLKNKLIPEYLQSHFASLRSMLESGVPTLRNKEGGHGQGPEIIDLPEHYSSYCLHLTASNLLFLMKCDEEYK